MKRNKQNIIYTISFNTTETDKIYIGSTIRPMVRKSQHLYLLRRKEHPNPHLQNAFNKYGEHLFCYTEIECVLSRKYLRIREQEILNLYFADQCHKTNGKDDRFYRLTYNLSPKVQTNGPVWTEERRMKLIESNKKRVWTKQMIEKSASKKRGKKQSKETRLKRKEVLLKRYKYKRDEPGRICPICSSNHTRKAGIRETKTYGLRQRMICQSCNKIYTIPVNLEGHYPEMDNANGVNSVKAKSKSKDMPIPSQAS